MKEAKIDGVRFHDLRHCAAGAWVESGVDIRTVPECMAEITGIHSSFGKWTFLNDFIVHICLNPGHEENTLPDPLLKQNNIHIASVHNHNVIKFNFGNPLLYLSEKTGKIN